MNVQLIPEELLKKQWEEYDFKDAEDHVFKMQCLLSKATYKKNFEIMKKISLKIVNSVDAKVLAVRKVSEKLNSSAGIDKVRWVKSSDKMNAVYSLTSKNYKAKPYRRLIIKDHDTGRERRINIPSMIDRAMQVLYMMALEPIEEALADRKSFAFRKGRSTFDVHSLIMKGLSGKNAPEFVLICDVKSYYDSISHQWLLNNVSMDKCVLRELLKAGFIFNNEIFPTDVGISLGCNISTILGNYVLDGIQRLLYSMQDSENMDYMEGYTIRFADDILVFSRTREKANEYLKKIKEFVSDRGLSLSNKKTCIVDVYNGFDFLSRHYFKKNTIIYSEPSKNAIKKMEATLYDTILNHKTKWSQKRLIETLNSKLIGWASYHKVENSTEAFKHIDIVVSGLLLNLMKEMYPKVPIKTLIKKYWYKDIKKREVFALQTDKNIRVIKLEDVILVDHKCLDFTRNIFLDREYFDKLLSLNEIQNVSGKYKNVWENQDGKCFYCGKSINKDQPRELVKKDITKHKTGLSNMAYIHSFCANDEMIYIKSASDEEFNQIDLKNVIREIKDVDIAKIFKSNSKYFKLYEFFAKCDKYTFNM